MQPGITDHAQVHGRSVISWEDKFDWDVKYVDHVTFLGEWKIILLTVLAVLKRDGISVAGEATMGSLWEAPKDEDHISNDWKDKEY